MSRCSTTCASTRERPEARMSDDDAGAGTTRPPRLARSERRAVVARPVAQAAVPAGGHVGLPRVVDPAGRDRDRVLVQRRPVRSTWQGFSFRWWYQDPFDSRLARPRAPNRRCSRPSGCRCSTMLIAVPLGIAVRHRDRPVARPAGRRAPTSSCCFSFVMPEIILGISLFLAVPAPARRSSSSGRTAQILGLVTYQIVVSRHHRPRPVAHRSGTEYEEAAMDLGALADASRSDGCCSRCCTRRSSRAPRSCSPTRSTTS